MIYHSPVGIIKIQVADTYVSEILYLNDKSEARDDPAKLSSKSKKILETTISQFDEYFAGKRKIFNVPIKQTGTDFQQKVWSELIKIPFGKTISYLQLAQRLGDVKSIRAAASANGRNKLSIIVPCHRVIGADGKLVGYGGGLPRKKWLLDHEAKFENGVSLLF
jgi:methylated-DNA-[protein]-cysteine S-methyltransferase